jgi:hypothetical protein
MSDVVDLAGRPVPETPAAESMMAAFGIAAPSPAPVDEPVTVQDLKMQLASSLDFCEKGLAHICYLARFRPEGFQDMQIGMAGLSAPEQIKRLRSHLDYLEQQITPPPEKPRLSRWESFLLYFLNKRCPLIAVHGDQL